MPDNSALSVGALNFDTADAKTSLKKSPGGFFGPCICCMPDLPNGWCMYPLTVGGYRVNYTKKMALLSIFSMDHNHFWIIWSDIFPLLCFIAMAVSHITSDRFVNHTEQTLQLLEAGVFFAVIVCRFCSGFFHVFNCTSVWSSQNLIAVDFYGISTMAFVGPYFYSLALSAPAPNPEKQLFSGLSFMEYITVNFSIAFLSYLIFSYNLKFGENKITASLQQPVLICLFAWGNVAAARVIFNTELPGFVHSLTIAAICLMCVGYGVFYKGLVPERFCRLGSTDGKIYNSHVIWHLLSSGSQLCYILVPFLYGNQAARAYVETKL